MLHYCLYVIFTSSWYLTMEADWFVFPDASWFYATSLSSNSVLSRMRGAAVILPVWGAQFGAAQLLSLCPVCVCGSSPWGWEVWAWAAIWRDHWWCILFNPLLTTPNLSIPFARPLPEEEMKGPPVLVVEETQLPWIDEWLLCHGSPLFACPAPPCTSLLAAACL